MGADRCTSFDPFEGLIGDSAAMQHVRARIQRIATTPVPVLILGETGTGKELCASAIARLSGQGPFVAVNCAAIPESLADSELFGHERGAFTGAVSSRSGVVAEANGGLLFLDELAELTCGVQAKLLRVLESGEFRPVGGKRVLHSRFRLLAATNADVDAAVRDGKLRADLVHRLGALRILIPPLRDRPEDIEALARHLLERYRQRAPQSPRSISSRALDLLRRHDWPGNVRQLRNVIEAAAALAGPASSISVAHLHEVLTTPPFTPATDREGEPLDLAEAARRAEMRVIHRALAHTSGNRERAAELLGISPATLYRRLRDLSVSSGHANGSDGSRD